MALFNLAVFCATVMASYEDEDMSISQANGIWKHLLTPQNLAQLHKLASVLKDESTAKRPRTKVRGPARGPSIADETSSQARGLSLNA